MIDPQLLRTRPEIIRQSQIDRGEDPALVDEAVAADASYRSLLQEFEAARAEQKTLSRSIGQASAAERAELLTQAAALAGRVKELEAAASAAQQSSHELLSSIANIPEKEVPAGGEDDFLVLREVGDRRDFGVEGITVQDHLQLATKLGAVDMERGAKVSGSRFYYLTGVGAMLDLAIMQLALAQAQAAGFTPMITPTLVRPEIMSGTGFLTQHADEIYHLPKDDLYLVGTSEVALAGYHADEIIDLSAGPKRYAGWSACYRREAGSAGRDTQGIIRVHQFHKLEMFSFTDPDAAAAEHDLFLKWQEDMMQALELPYRVIETAAGDLGLSAARKFDCEAYLPSQSRWLELTSTSNCTTFQARRLNIRQRGEKGNSPVATVNGTLGTTRFIVALLENHQQADGAVRVPAALAPYLGTTELRGA